MAEKKESLIVQIAGKIDPSLAQSVSKAEKIMGGVTKFSGGVASGMASVAKVGAMAIGATTAALGAAAGAAIKAGAEYESAFRDVQKTVNAPEGQNAEEFYDGLSDTIRQMAKEMPQSASSIAEVVASAGQLGIQAENLTEFSRAMIMMGDATNLSSEEAATQLAKFANITGMEQTQFGNLGSSIVALGNNMATTEADIVNMATNLAAAGSQVGMSEAQIVGFAAALSSVGMEAQAGGTAFSKLMVDMQLATEVGGESLDQFASVAGMSASEFQAAFKEDAASAIGAFVKGLANAEETGQSAIKILDDMGITEVRMRDSLLRAAGASELFDSAQQISNDAFREGNALANEASQRYTTLQSRIAILGNKVTDLGIAFYQSSTGPINDAVQFANDQIDLMANAYETGGLAGLANAAGQVGANTITALANAAPGAISAAGSMISSFVGGMQANWPQIVSAATQTIGMLAQGIATGLPQMVQTGFQMILTLAQGIVSSGSVQMLAQGATEAILKFIVGLVQNFPQIVEAGLQLIGQLVTGVLQGIANAAGEIWSNIKAWWNGEGDASAEAAAAGEAQANAYAQSVEAKLSEAQSINTAAVTPITVDTAAAEAQGSQYGVAIAQGITSSSGQVETATAGIDSMLLETQSLANNAIDTTQITTQAQTAQTSLQTAVTTMGGLWDQAVAKAVEAAASIKSAFENMTITVPRPKLPKINVSYTHTGSGEASLSVPNFSVQYFDKGGIMNRPTLFGMNGASAMIGGERRPEAITPLEDLWRELRGFAGEIVGTQRPAINYAPVFYVGAGANRGDIENASRMGLREFKKLYEEMVSGDRRKKL